VSITSEGTANIKDKLGKMTVAGVKCGIYKKTTQNENYKFFSGHTETINKEKLF
jgi:hypothetical protein